MLADDPLGTSEAVGPPRTEAVAIWIPLKSVCAPEDAGRNSSVGALCPASQPAMAGISNARTPAPSSRRPAAVFPELARITANAFSFRNAEGGTHSRYGQVVCVSTTGRRNAIGPRIDPCAGEVISPVGLGRDRLAPAAARGRPASPPGGGA